MIVVITKTDEAHYCSQAEAARLIGVGRSTIHRWMKKSSLTPVQYYNSFTVYLRSVKHKQNKGRPKLPPRVIMRQNRRRP